MAAKIWFQVAAGTNLSAALSIRRDGIQDVDDLRSAVTQACPGQMEGAEWTVLKVYEDVEAIKRGESLDVDAPIRLFGATRAKALVVQVPKIWFQLVDADTGDGFAGTSADSVPLADTQSVSTLKNEVKKKYSDSHLNGVAASDLKVYASRGAAVPLVGGAEIGPVGREEKAPVLVVVPQRSPSFRQLAPVKWKLAETALLPLQFGDNPLILVPEKYTRGSGLGTGDGDLLLYRRPELVQEWRALQKCVIDTHALLWIVGPPGTGKSCAAFAFACSLDRPSVWCVVWISCPKEGVVMSCIYFRGNGEKLECRVHPSQLSCLLDLLNGRIILFLDGYVEIRDKHGVLSACLFWRDKTQAHHRFVCVCSMVTRGKTWHREVHAQISPEKTKDVVPKSNVMTPRTSSRPAKAQELFRLTSWTLKNYQDALENDAIFNHVKMKFTTSTKLISPIERMTLLEEKYTVVGGSARLMFDVSTEDAVEALLEAINTAQDIEAYVNNKVGIASDGAVNRLFPWYPKPGEVLPQACLLSKFVARELASKLGPDYVENIAKSLGRNPSMDGHFLELWFFAALTHKAVVCIRDGVEHCVWTAASLPKFDPSYGIPLDAGAQWFVPQSWNQGGYDAVFVEIKEADAEEIAKEGYARKILIRFVQITRAQTYTFKPECFCSLLTLLNFHLQESEVWTRVETVELYYVVPSSIHTNFRPQVSSQQFEADVLKSAFMPRRRDEVICLPRVEICVVGVNWDGGNQSPPSVGMKRVKREAS